MRTAKVLALGLMLTLASAGCAGKGDDGTQVATARTGGPAASAGPRGEPSRDPDVLLKFARCMRQNGVPWFPDPDTSGLTRITPPKGFDPKKMETAQQACRQFQPEMDGDRRLDPEKLETMRQMAKCMRENGVPDFPDPSADGGIRLDAGKLGAGPGDPTFDKAEQKCSKYMPKPEGVGAGTVAERPA